MRRFLFAVVALAIVGLGAPTTTQAADPSAVARALNDAMNAHDVDAAVALIADDAVVHAQGQTFTGREQIRGWIVSLAQQDFQSRVVGPTTVTGDTVVLREDILVDDWRRVGLDPLATRVEITVRDDLVSSITTTIFPESQARLQGALPRSGGPAMSLTAALGAALVCLGLIVRRT